MQVMLEVTVVAQTLHLAQVTNNFRNRYGSFLVDSLSTVVCYDLLTKSHSLMYNEYVKLTMRDRVYNNI